VAGVCRFTVDGLAALALFADVLVSPLRLTLRV